MGRQDLTECEWRGVNGARSRRSCAISGATFRVWMIGAPQMRARARRDGSRCGAIVVSSAAAFRSSSDNWACYAATKAFAVNFAQSLAAELQHDPADILVLCPIYTATGFFARAGYPQPDKAMTPEEVARETMEALGRRTVHIFGLNRAINRLSAQSRQFIMLLLARNPDGIARGLLVILMLKVTLSCIYPMTTFSRPL
jgi:short-subunit dehydrogenase